MGKKDDAQEICDLLDLDYYQVYNEGGANVTARFLTNVREALEQKQHLEETIEAAYKLADDGEAPCEKSNREVLEDLQNLLGRSLEVEVNG